jgi:hypothetical protein
MICESRGADPANHGSAISGCESIDFGMCADHVENPHHYVGSNSKFMIVILTFSTFDASMIIRSGAFHMGVYGNRNAL